MSPQAAPDVSSLARRNLLFVGGKGGVGKTVVSRAIAHAHAARGQRTLWVTFEDPTRPQGELKQIAKNLWELNCEASAAFEEYAELKIGAPRLTRIFLQNKLMRYLSQAAPGIHELVLLGKVWYERSHYDHVVVDMPSTGYGLAMFQSTDNFARLFKGGPIHNDAEAMLDTFRDPVLTGHLIVALPEEMPLVESLELRDYLLKLFPKNSPALLVTRLFPPQLSAEAAAETDLPHSWENPLASSALDYARKRTVLESHNLRIWREREIKFGELQMVPPPATVSSGAFEVPQSKDDSVISALTRQLGEKNYV